MEEYYKMDSASFYSIFDRVFKLVMEDKFELFESALHNVLVTIKHEVRKPEELKDGKEL